MKTLNQSENDKDIWKTHCFQFAEALLDIMSGTSDHDIQSETGFSQEDCDRIAKARSDARTLLIRGNLIKGVK